MYLKWKAPTSPTPLPPTPILSLHATGWWKSSALSLQQLAECNTNPRLNYCSPLSVLKLHLSALTRLPPLGLVFYFPAIYFPPFFLLLKCSWEALTEMADKSIAITTPVFSFLSRASSSFIFLPQQLLGDPSVALIALLSWAFTSYFLLSAATLLL